MTEILELFAEDLARSPLEENGFGALMTTEGALPLRAMHVDVRISASTSLTTLRQEFFNGYARPLEITYIFPLPPHAALSHFEVELGGHVVVADLKEHDQAVQEYHEAVAAGHRAALAEEVVPDIFRLSVGNLPAGEVAKVCMKMSAPLVLEGASASYRFPLVTPERYVPSRGPSTSPGHQQDQRAASESTHEVERASLRGYPLPIDLGLEVRLDTGGAQLLELQASLQLAPEQPIDRDFILRWRLAEDAITTSCVASEPSAEHPGHFQLVLTPPAELPAHRRPRDIALVFDRSGSMDGWPMIGARRALQSIIETLTSEDRVHIVSFANDMTHFPSKDAFGDAVPALRDAANKHIDALLAFGGTEMASPLVHAANLLEEDAKIGRDQWLVLLTDGQIMGEEMILEQLAKRLGKTRIFAVGIGQGIDKSFLTRLAHLGRGSFEHVESRARLDEVMHTFHRAIDAPLLTQITLHGAGITLSHDDTTPSRTDTLFSGRPLVIHGRYKGALSEDAFIEVLGEDANGEQWSKRVDVREGEHPSIDPIWARSKIQELEDQWSVERSPGLQNEIVDLSMQYHVLCRFTAYIAVDHTVKIAKPRDTSNKETLLGSANTDRMFLKFISGKYQGGEFPLREDAAIEIGSSSDMDMVLVEKTVSPKHARITKEGALFFIEDLSSKTGVYVNGEQVSRAPIIPEDRILIGSSILQLMSEVGEDPSIQHHWDKDEGAHKIYTSYRPVPRSRQQVARSNSNTITNTIAGLVDEVPLPDLLQLFASSMKSGEFVIRAPEGTGVLTLERGRIVFAIIDGREDLHPNKALHRILDWNAGTFSLEAPTVQGTQKVHFEPVEDVLMEHFIQKEEMEVLLPLLPDRDTEVVMQSPPPMPLGDLPDEHEVLFAYIREGRRSIEELLDHGASSDLDAVKSILYLLEQGWIKIKS